MSEPLYSVERFARAAAEYDAPADRARFEQMISRHHRRLRKVVAGVIADPNRVDDVLQEAYYNAYRKLPRAFANEAHESTWLYRGVYRCSLNELRSRRRRPESAVGEVELTVVGNEPQRRLELEDAFRTLSPADRAVLLLVGVLDLDYASAAAILGVPRGTLAWRLSTARARFR